MSIWDLGQSGGVAISTTKFEATKVQKVGIIAGVHASGFLKLERNTSVLCTTIAPFYWKTNFEAGSSL